MARLKVFGGLRRGRGKSQVRTIVAAASQSKAAEILNIRLSYFKSVFCETQNTRELDVALSSPGVIFQASDTMTSDYLKVSDLTDA